MHLVYLFIPFISDHFFFSIQLFDSLFDCNYLLVFSNWYSSIVLFYNAIVISMDEKFFNQKILPISNSTHCLLFSMTQQHTHTSFERKEQNYSLTSVLGLNFFFQVYKVYFQCYLVIIYQSSFFSIVIWEQNNKQTKIKIRSISSPIVFHLFLILLFIIL